MKRWRRWLPRLARLLTTLWAVVNTDGMIARGKGVTSSIKSSTREYEIIFRQSVISCTYSATFDHDSGFISPMDSSIGSREVGVTTLNRSGIVRDSSFHLIVHC